MKNIIFTGADLSRSKKELDDSKRTKGVADYAFERLMSIRKLKRFLAKVYGIKLTAEQESKIKRRLKWLEMQESKNKFKDSLVLEK